MKKLLIQAWQAGRDTPCAPFGESRSNRAANRVARPAKSRDLFVSWLAVLLAFASASGVLAQYSISRHSFSAATGAESSDGSFSVSSTVGTTGGGNTASSGNFSVTSSPWMVAVVETPGSPKLSIAAASGSVQVSWPSPATGWVLQQNTNSVSSVNWSNVTATIQDDGTNRVFLVNQPTGNRFYRLFKP